MLAQTLRPLETIVVDDGSTDGSAAIARSFGDRIRYSFQTRGGSAAARNLGVQLARGNFLGFLDADDLWLPEKLSVQAVAFAADPALDLAFGLVAEFRAPEARPAPPPGRRGGGRPVPGYLTSALLVRRASFARVGEFETDLKQSEFASWYLRARDMGLHIAMIPELVARRRLHGQNKGVRGPEAYVEYSAALKASLDRRRRGGNSTSKTVPKKS